MKLGELRGAIRKTKGNPWFDCFPFPGTDKTVRFYLQKSQLLEELEKAYPGGKGTETELVFDAETGQLRPEHKTFQGISKDNPAAAPAPPYEGGDADLDLDDVLTVEEDDILDL